MAKAKTDIRSLARAHTPTAIKILAHIMMQPKTPPASRIAAASELLSRGWGRPAQFVELSGEVQVSRIERVIVDEQGLQPVIDESGTVLSLDTSDGETIN